MKNGFRFLIAFLLLSLCTKTHGQSFSEYKQKLEAESKKYATTVPCEGETRKAVENLNELIWANPSQNTQEKNRKIVESCKFVKNKGCPQVGLKTILDEMITFYSKTESVAKTVVGETVNPETPVANIPDSLVSPEEENPVKQNAATTDKGISSFFWILSFLVLLLMSVCSWLIFMVLKKPHITYIQANQKMNNELLDKVEDNNLVNILKELRDELGKLRNRIAHLESEIEDLKSKGKEQKHITVDSPEAEIRPSIQIKERNTPSREDSYLPPPPPIVAENTRYALYMDNSEGFSVGGLMHAEGHETIYLIGITSPQNATYRICANLDAQAYALSDPGYYLRTACDYDNSPTSGKHIETLTEGSLELSGNIWKITKRARIRFV